MSIRTDIEEKLLCSPKENPVFSILVKLSFSGRWLEMGKRVKHFWGMVHVKRVDTESIPTCLLQFLQVKALI